MSKSVTRILGIAAVLALVAVAAFGALAVYADEPGTGLSCLGRGARAGQGEGQGVLAPVMHDALAQALGITADDLTARHDAGQTLAEIAAELKPGEDAQALWSQARTTALEQAVEQGLISQEQADWMATRGAGRGAGAGGRGAGMRAGICDGTGIQRGGGFGARLAQQAG